MPAALTDAPPDGAGPQVSRPAEVAVELRGVSKIFGAGEAAVQALDDVSLAIRANEFFTLLGPSGCGKTTLLRLIAGFEHPSRGAILLHGEDISDQPPHRRPVNTVFQSYALFPHLSVAGNIGFGLEMLGRPQGGDRGDGRAHAADGQDDRAARAGGPAELSGGQQQRVALARALAPRPRVLLLDEPLSALDLKLRKEMQIELKRLQHETGITFVFVTHDQEEALTMSDRIAVMSEGRILQIGAPREIYDHPAERFVASFIGETNFLDGRNPGGSRASGRACGSPAASRRPPTCRRGRPGRRGHDRGAARACPAGGRGRRRHDGGDARAGGLFRHRHPLPPAPRRRRALVARVQNLRDGAPPPAPGARLGVRLRPGAIQILRD